MTKFINMGRLDHILYISVIGSKLRMRDITVNWTILPELQLLTSHMLNTLLWPWTRILSEQLSIPVNFNCSSPSNNHQPFPSAYFQGRNPCWKVHSPWLWSSQSQLKTRVLSSIPQIITACYLSERSCSRRRSRWGSGCRTPRWGCCRCWWRGRHSRASRHSCTGNTGYTSLASIRAFLSSTWTIKTYLSVSELTHTRLGIVVTSWQTFWASFRVLLIKWFRLCNNKWVNVCWSQFCHRRPDGDSR